MPWCAATSILGRRDLRMNERGNGVQIWRATPGSVVEDNDIRYGRDGIFVTTSKNNAFRDNRFQRPAFRGITICTPTAAR